MVGCLEGHPTSNNSLKQSQMFPRNILGELAQNAGACGESGKYTSQK